MLREECEKPSEVEGSPSRVHAASFPSQPQKAQIPSQPCHHHRLKTQLPFMARNLCSYSEHPWKGLGEKQLLLKNPFSFQQYTASPDPKKGEIKDE